MTYTAHHVLQSDSMTSGLIGGHKNRLIGLTEIQNKTFILDKNKKGSSVQTLD